MCIYIKISEHRQARPQTGVRLLGHSGPFAPIAADLDGFRQWAMSLGLGDLFRVTDDSFLWLPRDRGGDFLLFEVVLLPSEGTRP